MLQAISTFVKIMVQVKGIRIVIGGLVRNWMSEQNNGKYDQYIFNKNICLKGAHIYRKFRMFTKDNLQSISHFIYFASKQIKEYAPGIFCICFLDRKVMQQSFC